MPKLVVHLAMLDCEAGTAVSLLQTTAAATVTSCGDLMGATQHDFAVGVNIDNFGFCKADPEKKLCRPVVPFPWSCPAVDVPLSSQPALTEQSKLKCLKFDKEIAIFYAGQATVEVSDNQKLDDDDSPWLPLLGSVAIAAGVDGPLPFGDIVGGGIAIIGGGAIVYQELTDDDDSNDDSIPAERDGAARGDPHGRKAPPSMYKQRDELAEQLASAKRDGGPKKEKKILEQKIKNIGRAIDKAEKGETHWRRGK